MADSSEALISTPETVKTYLEREFEITSEDADKLIFEHLETINKDHEMRSFAYWTGDKIAQAAKLTPREEAEIENNS